MGLLNYRRLSNNDFLAKITESFGAFLSKGTSRSTDKLKPLHGAIAEDLAARLNDGYEIRSQGFGNDREASIAGRYVDKKADITIFKGGRAVGGIAVKFVMQNYSQNSNNYFEGMLGETANIRCAGCPYFQVFIILDHLPYYRKDKSISKWESFTDHNVKKYLVLSQDNSDVMLHTPNKTLIYVVHVPDAQVAIRTQAEYLDYYRNNDHTMRLTDHRYAEFGPGVIFNDYETFIEKVYHAIMAL